MKIVFALLHPDAFRHVERVVRLLLEERHSVLIVTDLHAKNSHPNSTGRSLFACKKDFQDNCRIEHWIRRDDAWQNWLFMSRELINYGLYFKPQHPSKGLKFRWKKYLPPWLWKRVGNAFMGKLLSLGPIMFLLRLVDKMAPPSRPICRWLKTVRPDVVLAMSGISPGSIEIEYIKAAKALHIPSIIAIASWDNLTTKGTYHVIPSLALVWNNELVKEAVELHGLPGKIVVATGAPTFDFWFDLKPTISREDFCREVGLDPNHPYIVYLCSSRGMIKEETIFVQTFIRQLRANPLTENVSLLVRPHPLNMINWMDLESDRVRVWPRGGEFSDILSARQDYYHAFFYCRAVLGINTSAMLEAAVADRPCLTVIDPRYKSAQGDMGHFRHLMRGGFLEVASSYEEAVNLIASILQGNDPRQKERRCFVKEFIRPCGMDREASAIMADLIKKISNK